MNDIQNTPIKRRGRKPKGGRLIQNAPPNTLCEDKSKSAVIVHLKCNSKDLPDITSDFTYDPNLEIVTPYSELKDTYKYLTPESNNDCANYTDTAFVNDDKEPLQQDQLVKQDLQQKHITNSGTITNLCVHLENMNLKNIQSCCFWCTYDFSNKPYHIPKSITEPSINVYGNFCTPECAMAYLLHENLDDTEKLERSHLLNYIYPSNNNQNIKPALNPYYSLSRFFGNLSIDEFRALSSKNKHYMLIEKPMTLINPELHEDNQQISCSTL